MMNNNDHQQRSRHRRRSGPEYSPLEEQHEANQKMRVKYTTSEISSIFSFILVITSTKIKLGLVSLSSHALLLKGQPKLQWCCGAFAVAITVMMTALMVTLISSSPLIFLRLCEITQGELDFAIYPLNAPSLNYTLVEDLMLQTNDSQYFLNSPRVRVSAQAYSAARCMNQSQEEFSYFDPRWKYIGVESSPCNTSGDWIELHDSECNRTDRVYTGDHSCFDYYCRQSSRSARVFLIDTERERKMVVGRNWNYEKIPRNCTYIHQQLAQSLGLSVGDVIYLQFNPSEAFSIPFREYYFSIAYVAFQVCQIFSDPKGKDEATGTPNWVFAEYESFLQYISDQLHPDTSAELISDLKTKANPYHYAQNIGFQVPEAQRMHAYLQRNFDTMNRLIYGEYGSGLMFHLGFLEIGLNPNLIFAMRDKETLSLAFSMIMSVVVSVMMLLCILVIYSLLSVSVEMRSRSAAIFRMLGLSEWGLVQSVLAQALLIYVVPGWILGIMGAQGLLSAIFHVMSKFTLVPIFAWLSTSAILLSIVQGIVVPLIASIEPISIALQKSIVRALDSNRPLMTVVEYSIQRADVFFSEETTAIVTAGSAVSVIGFLLYYYVPWSLVSGQQSFLVLLFVLVLLGMFCGLSMLAQSVQPFVEPVVMKLLCFWESNVVRNLALGNMRAHRKRNRTSAMMFTIAVGLVVFIMIVLDIQFSSFVMSLKQQWGCDLKVQNHYGMYNSLPVVDLETIADRNREFVESFSWVSHDYNSCFWDITNGTRILTLGRMSSQDVRLYPIFPDFYETQFDRMLQIYRPDGQSAAEIVDRLYSISGRRSLIISTAYAETMNLKVGDTVLLAGVNASEVLELEVAAFFSYSPTYIFKRRNAFSQTTALVSLPLFVKFGAGEEKLSHSPAFESPPAFFEGLAKEFHMRLQKNASTDSVRYKCFKRELVRGRESWLEVHDTAQRMAPLLLVQKAFGFFFDFAILAASLICLSSLVAASMIKIHDQSKDIGVMLALGMPAASIRRAFYEESTVVIFSAGLLGIFIGSTVGWLVSAQQQIFSDGPIAWRVPIRPVLVMLVVSIVLGISATSVPLRSLLKRNPISILRDAN